MILNLDDGLVLRWRVRRALHRYADVLMEVTQPFGNDLPWPWFEREK
jgi:hypothetical protein